MKVRKATDQSGNRQLLRPFLELGLRKGQRNCRCIRTGCANSGMYYVYEWRAQ